MGQIESQVNIPNKDAIIVAQSQLVVDELKKEFPKVVEQLNHNREATINLLVANGMLSAFRVVREFNVPHVGNDNIKTWSEYREVIEHYITDLCQQFRTKNGRTLVEELEPARVVLSNHIHEEIFTKLPYWPAVGNVQTAVIKLNITGSYPFGGYHIIWTCVGSIKYTDERPEVNIFKALFSGQPEIKILILNIDKLKDMERMLALGSFEMNARMIEKKYREREGSHALTWEDL